MPFYAFSPFPTLLFLDLLLFVRDESAYYAYNDRNDYLVALAFCFLFFPFFLQLFFSFLPIYEQSALQGKLFLFLGMNSDVNNLKYKELGRSCNWSISMDRFPGSYLFIFFSLAILFISTRSSGQTFYFLTPWVWTGVALSGVFSLI